MEDRIGIDFSSSGSVMTSKQLEEQRRKRGQCLSCGQKCFQKKLFSMIPLTIHGNVLNGRCLKCKPLDIASNDTVLPAVSRPATRQDMERFTRSQSSLRLQGPGDNSSGPLRRTMSAFPAPTGHTYHRGLSNASLGSTGTASSNQGGNPGGGGYRSPTRATSTGVARISEDTSLRDLVAGREHSSRSDPSADGGDLDTASHRSSGGGSLGNRRGRVVNRASSMNPDIRRRDGSEIMPRRGSDLSGHSPAPPSHSSRESAVARDSPVPLSAAAILEHAPKHPPLSSTNEEEEQDEAAGPSIHASVIGGMAARKMVENFRSRRAARLEVPEESAPLIFDDSLSPEGENLGERLGANNIAGGSSHSRDSRSWKTDEDDLNNYRQEPVHGILNRGGEIKFIEDQIFPLAEEGTPLPPFSTMHAESSRTMSDMSSIDEEGNGNGRQLSWKPAAEFSMKKRAADLYEQDDIDDLSIDSDTGASKEKLDTNFETRSQLSSRSGRPCPSHSRHEQEHRAIESLSAQPENYDEIINIMKDFASSELVQQEGLKHISNLHLSDAEYIDMMQIGALSTVIEAMTTHSSSAELQSGACRAIWNLSATAQNQIRLVQEGALDCILAAMDTFPAEAELQEKALAALSNLGAATENQSIIMRKEAIERIVEAMNRHSEDGPVQSKACSALTNFASYDSPLKRQIMKVGGGGAVVISMIMHPEDIDLQEKALRALRNICANSDENKVEIANVGGIDAVISAMQVHRDEAGIQEAGAWTLSNLAVNPENKTVIGDSGGIDVVIRAMWVHSDNVGVQEWCCRALWTLSVDAQNRQVMMEVGGISAVVNAMQAHADAATVQEKGCGVLSNLAATDDESKMRIVEEEALDAIIMAMVLHSENRSVQDRACSVLKRLAIGPNLKPMQAANVGELVRQAARQFPEKCQEKASAIVALLD